MAKEKISIAIDGPAAAGKSTVSKIVAERLGYVYVDTGAMYRAITYKALRSGTDPEDGAELAKLLAGTRIELKKRGAAQLVFLDGEDVSEAIRTPEVTNTVSAVSAHAEVREELVRRQQLMGLSGGIVMDGRDIGTSVLPGAELKIFLLASAEVRARRRYAENTAKGFGSNLSVLLEEIKKRDKLDSERAVSPLKKAPDAIEVDASDLTVEEVVERIYQLAMERIEGN